MFGSAIRHSLAGGVGADVALVRPELLGDGALPAEGLLLVEGVPMALDEHLFSAIRPGAVLGRPARTSHAVTPVGVLVELHVVLVQTLVAVAVVAGLLETAIWLVLAAVWLVAHVGGWRRALLREGSCAPGHRDCGGKKGARKA